MHTALGALVSATHPLPEPKAGWTIPLAIVLALLAVFALLKKLIALALLATLAAAVFFAYQGGAFDHYVDQGKQVLQNQSPLNNHSTP
jgi:hypothetical protein